MTQTDTATPSPARNTPSPLIITLVIVGALLVGFYMFANLFTDYLWYEQLGFAQVLQVRWLSLIVMFLIGFVAMAVPLALTIQIAFRSRPVYAQLNSQLDRYQELVEPLRKVGMWLVPAIFGVFAGVAAASNWDVAQLWLNGASFGETDAQFGLDVGFYVFALPFYQQVASFAMAVLFACAVAALATAYLYGAIRINGREVRISRSARIQVGVIAALYMAALAASIWLGQYSAMTTRSQGGNVPTGAGFTEANASIPAQQILAGIAALVVIFFIISAIIGKWRHTIVGVGLLIVASLVVGTAYPAIIQRFQVDPSARTLESQYIEHNIEATRAAFGVNEMVEVSTDATTTATEGALAADAQTTASIRIIDPALVSSAFANLQEYRQYYSFGDSLDVDRYEIDGEVQDTVIAVRELDAENLSEQDRSWYNQHIVYTHGYGVVAAAGNKRGPEGQPVFLQSGIPTTGSLGEYEPRVYFGESSPEYSIVGGPEGADPLELDYPRESDEASGNAYTTFNADGGPSVGNLFSRLLYAIKFQSEQIVLSDALNDESQILYNRDPRSRVQAVAPFLTLDQDPYPAIVDGRLVWFVDGFTTTSQYPYSTQVSMAGSIADATNPNPVPGVNDTVNYIRNSVKAVVDAYDGSVTLYAWDDKDPILQAWNKVFPGSITPMSEMSGDMLAHVRYPQDLFKVQRAILGDYHVTNPGTFYSSDDQWITPREPTASQNGGQAPFQPPYYLTMSVNGEDPAFTLYSTYIPRNGRDVLYGYLSVNADAGSTQGEIADSYGQLTLQMLPKNTSIPGPGQVQNNFDTDNSISGQLNILQQGSSKVIKGNLLTLPVGGGLLYVQPVYLESTGATSFPVLRKILVAFGDNIAMADTLDAALDELFGGDSGAEAGDSGAPPGEATGGETPAEGGTTASLQAQLDRVLQQAKTALQERQAAYAENDLVAAAEADNRLQVALEEAIALSDRIDQEAGAAGGDAGGDTGAPEETPAP